MICDQYEDAILDRARHAGMDSAIAAALESHLALCAACGARVERDVSLTAGLAALAKADADAGPSGRLEERLLQAFHAHHRVPVAPRASGQWRAWVAAAAVVAIVSGIAVAWRSVATRPEVVVTENLPPPKLDATAEATGLGGSGARDSGARGLGGSELGGSESTAGPRPAATGANRTSRRPNARLDPRVVRPAGFVMIPGAASLPQFESGTIERVELSAGSLPSYGVEIPPDAGASPVQADILVGQDGQPRAIRLVTVAAESRSRQ